MLPDWLEKEARSLVEVHRRLEVEREQTRLFVLAMLRIEMRFDRIDVDELGKEAEDMLDRLIDEIYGETTSEEAEQISEVRSKDM